MARGRFIDKQICIDKKVNCLSCPDSMLGFTWLITHLDREGRTYGDPEIVKSMIFPRRRDIDINRVEEFIAEWNQVGLIILYEADEELFIQFPNFDKYQIGLRKDREPESIIPMPEDCRIIAGKHPAEVKLIKRQLKVKVEGEGDGEGKLVCQTSAEKSEKAKIHSLILEYFIQQSNLSIPENMSYQQKTEKWFDPIADICDLVDYDPDRAKQLIDSAIKKYDSGDLKFPIASPKSIRSIAIGLAGKKKRDSAMEFRADEFLEEQNGKGN